MTPIYQVKLTYKKIGEMESIAIQSAQDVVGALKKLLKYDAMKEHTFVVLMNGSNQVIGINECTLGLRSQAPIDPVEVFKPAILASASSIIFAHNHPSGNPNASPEDLKVTATMIEVGKLLTINVLDSIILIPMVGWTSIRATNPQLWR